MPKKLNKLRRSDPSVTVIYRAATFGDQAREDDQSVPVTIATETPVEIFDWQRGAVVNEVMLMDGLEFPSQIPIVDSHDRSTVRNILGSIRELEVKNGSFVGRAFFSRKESAVETFRDIQDGHVTDFSITAQPTNVQFVEEGETTTVRDRNFTGPLKLVSAARAIDGSVVAVGADPNAKVTHAMRAYVEPNVLLEEFEMTVLRELAIKHGMPEDHEGDVQRWLDDNVQRKPAPKPEPAPVADPVVPVKPVVTPQPASGPTAHDAVTRALAIRDLCEKHGITIERANAWIADDNTTIDQVSRQILDELQPTGKPVGQVQPVDSADDKFFDAISHGLTINCLRNARLNPHMALQRARGVFGEGDQAVSSGSSDPDAIARSQELVQIFEKPAVGAEDFRYASLSDIARKFVERAGGKTFNVPKHEIVRQAMAMQPVIRMGSAYHDRSSFTNLLLDASNKTLLAGYDEADVTYPLWVRTAPSAADFKTLNRIRFGEIPDPEIVPENAEYKEKAVSDANESYAIEKHGSIFSISLEAVVNDDLNAISRIPMMQGAAMRRKINRSVYAILTANDTLVSDSIALFHATSHNANLDTVALSATSIGTGFTVMMTQSGLDSNTILNIMPRFLIVPAALAATALTIVNSTADPTVGGDVTGSSGVVNIYGPGQTRRLIPVV